MVLHDHMAGQGGITRHDDVIAQQAVVGDVRVGEQQVVRAEDGRVAIIRRAMDGHPFAENVPVADLQPRDAAFPLQVLGLLAEGGEREDFIFPAEFRVAVQDDMGMQFAAVAQGDVFADDAVRPDFAIGTNLCLRMNDRR